MTPEKAEILALEALGWLAAEPDAIGRLMEQSGTDAPSLRQSAGTPEMAVAVLDFLLADDALLLRFCDHADVTPRDIHLARHRLGGE